MLPLLGTAVMSGEGMVEVVFISNSSVCQASHLIWWFNCSGKPPHLSALWWPQ